MKLNFRTKQDINREKRNDNTKIKLTLKDKPQDSLVYFQFLCEFKKNMSLFQMILVRVSLLSSLLVVRFEKDFFVFACYLLLLKMINIVVSIY